MEYDTLDEFLGVQYEDSTAIDEVWLYFKSESILEYNHDHPQDSRISGYSASLHIWRICVKSCQVSS